MARPMDTAATALLWLVAAVPVGACDTASMDVGPPSDAPQDVSSMDIPTPEPDQAEPQDAQTPDVPPPPPPLDASIVLNLDDARFEGDVWTDEDVEGRNHRVLDSGSSATWAFDLTTESRAVLWLNVGLWRYESSRLTLALNGETTAIEAVDAYARPGLVPTALWPADQDKSPLVVTLPSGQTTLSITASSAIRLYGARLDPSDAPTAPYDPVFTEWRDGPETLELSPCSDPDCDDSETLSGAIEALGADGGTLVLSEGRFHLQRPVVIARSGIKIRGQGSENTHIIWNPAENFGNWDAAITFQGGGDRGEAVAVLEGVSAHARAVLVDGDPGWEIGGLVRLEAEDHGEVPARCVGGRDVERVNRHITWIARLVSIEAEGQQHRLVFDRQFSHDIPPEAQPRLRAVSLLEGVGVRDIGFEAHCPEAEALEMGIPRAVDCANPAVLNHSAVRLLWTERALVQRVSSKGFGRFGVEVTNSIEARVEGGRMSKPSDYGSGGKGYGVHVIRSGRTLVEGFEVEQARHGVVIDFGSTETQVVRNAFSRSTAAAVDIHGEASLDTLVLGCVMDNNLGAVVFGGGGNEVHCNDGPRHHAIGNRAIDNFLYGISATDHTQRITVRRNLIEGSGLGVMVDGGAGTVEVDANTFERSTHFHIQLSGARHGTGPISMSRNRFDPDSETLYAEEGIELGAQSP